MYTIEYLNRVVEPYWGKLHPGLLIKLGEPETPKTTIQGSIGTYIIYKIILIIGFYYTLLHWVITAKDMYIDQ